MGRTCWTLQRLCLVLSSPLADHRMHVMVGALELQPVRYIEGILDLPLRTVTHQSDLIPHLLEEQCTLILRRLHS